MFFANKFQKAKQYQGKTVNIFLNISEKVGLGTPENTEKTAHLIAQCNLPRVIWKCSFPIFLP